MPKDLIYVRIKERSLIARIAGIKLGVRSVAIVFGRTIFLHNASRFDLIANKRWLIHELTHVRQWHREGYIKFLLKYLWFSIRYGYRMNPFEKEAREMETYDEILNDFKII